MDESNMNCEDSIILLIYRNRSHLNDRRLPFEVCRKGIGATEGFSVIQVSEGVHKLECSGFVFGEKRYVETRRGPCMAYSLTPLGTLRAKILGSSNYVPPKSIPVKAERVEDIALLNRRSIALITKSLSRKIGGKHR